MLIKSLTVPNVNTFKCVSNEVLSVSNGADICKNKPKQNKHLSLVFYFGGAFDFTNIFNVAFL